jgi:hypothetical protein
MKRRVQIVPAILASIPLGAKFTFRTAEILGLQSGA